MFLNSVTDSNASNEDSDDGPAVKGNAKDAEDDDEGPSVIKYLLEKGAIPNAEDTYGTTPLHICCMRGTAKSAKELLEHEATNHMVRN